MRGRYIRGLSPSYDVFNRSPKVIAEVNWVGGGVTTPADIFEHIPQLMKKGKKIALCTVVGKIGSGPAEKGRKILVTEDAEVIGTIGGGTLERNVKEEALKAIREGKPKILKFALYGGAKRDELETGLWCGGTLTLFVDVVEPDPKLIIVGSGHIALPTYRITDLLGFNVTVVDDNRETLTEDRFPDAKRICDENFKNALKAAKVDESTYIVIVHGEPKHDLSALQRFIHEKTAYLGILGSKGKINKLTENLRKNGVPEEKIKKVRAPVGLDIGAKTPEEIAVSIAAELIQEKRRP